MKHNTDLSCGPRSCRKHAVAHVSLLGGGEAPATLTSRPAIEGSDERLSKA